VLHPFVCRLDDSERNYKMRPLRCFRNACDGDWRVKFRRDDGNNYPRNQQHADEFEPAIHGQPGLDNWSNYTPNSASKYCTNKAPMSRRTDRSQS